MSRRRYTPGGEDLCGGYLDSAVALFSAGEIGHPAAVGCLISAASREKRAEIRVCLPGAHAYGAPEVRALTVCACAEAHA